MEKAERTYFPKADFLHKYYYDIEKIVKNCSRCSNCKWIDQWEIKEPRFSKVCPSVAYSYFDAYSSQGRHDIILAWLEGRMSPDMSENKMLEVLYTCDTCGGCDASCKRSRDTEVIRMFLDVRAKLVEAGDVLPEHIPVIESLRNEDNTMMGKKKDRGNWVSGLKVKDLTEEKAEVVFHAGCHISFNEDLWDVGKTAVKLLQKLGVDVGIFGKNETCCGTKAWDMGYRGEYKKYAENNVDAWSNAGVKTVITACSDCYYAFKRLYPEKFEVYHIVEYIDKLIKEGKIKFTKTIPMTVTYHDPCHLGRRSNVYEPGKAIMGVYDPPRDILKSIPGIKLIEMYRIKEYAWCCGAGGGLREAYPERSAWTANERITEAVSTGAEAIVSACPWCENNFNEAVRACGAPIKVLDVLQLVDQAL